MADYQQRDLNGSLFINDRKRDGKNDPDYSGSCRIDGVDYWLSAWIKQGAKGEFYSLAFKRKDGAPGQPSSTPAPTAQKPASKRQLPPQQDISPEGSEPPF